MSDEPSGRGRVEGVSSYFDAVNYRADESSLCTRLAVRDDLRDATGALRIGAVTYAVDIATGIATGLAVLDRDEWVVTTDIDVVLTAPIIDGPLRVDAEVVRAGATTAVAAVTLTDEGAGERRVGGGTATTRPFAFPFDRSVLHFPIGVELRFDRDRSEVTGEPMATRLGFRRVAPDPVLGAGVIDLELVDWVRNPWGILHGGVTACMVDVAAEAAGEAAFGGPVRCEGALVRYLAPAKVGPVRAVPHLVARQGGRALVEVRVTDEGAGRVAALATLTVAEVGAATVSGR